MKFRELEPVPLTGNKSVNEKWLQEQIASHPQILGLGNVRLVDKERRQFNNGRLDLLLEDDDDDSDYSKRYVCELQLGRVNPDHIIRTVEYWDLERKRYPKRPHVAVLIGEDVESRYLNVLQLFNRQIPLVVLKMTAFDVEGDIALVFTKVFDETGCCEAEEEDEEYQQVKRDDWLERSNPAMMKLMDALFEEVKEIGKKVSGKPVEYNYNKHYVGLKLDGIAKACCKFKLRKQYVRMFCSPMPEETIIEEAKATGLDVDRQQKDKRVAIRLSLIPKGAQLDCLRKMIRFSFMSSNK